MSSTVISVENLSKSYQLGQINTGTFSRDLEVWWAKLRGQPNPLLRIGETDHGNRDGEELWALKDVSFTVEQGEVLGIIGRNGAGKSTLLKILSRVTAPTSGRVRVKGRIASLLEVGTGFHPELTGRENIYLNGAILGMQRSEIERKFDEIVDFAEVEKFIDTPVKRYSSGMYVRLAFAVAAHLDPEILVVDEVLAVGDAEFQKKCLGKMGDVAKEGRTVLFVSHNMGAVESLCNHCLLLYKGQNLSISNNVHEIIREYISFSLTKKENEFIFTPINTSEFELIDFYLSSRREKIKTNHFTESDDIDIKIKVLIKESLPNLSIGYALYDTELNICLWWSFNVDNDSKTLRSGVNILNSTIPKALLNDRTYRIEIIAGINNQKWVCAPGQSPICIEFIVKGGMIGSVKFSSTRRPTMLKPLFPWEVEHHD